MQEPHVEGKRSSPYSLQSIPRPIECRSSRGSDVGNSTKNPFEPCRGAGVGRCVACARHWAKYERVLSAARDWSVGVALLAWARVGWRAGVCVWFC